MTTPSHTGEAARSHTAAAPLRLWAPRLSAIAVPAAPAPAVGMRWQVPPGMALVELGTHYTPAGAAALLRAARSGSGVVLVHAGAGGGALLATLAAEEPVQCLTIEVAPGSAKALETARAFVAAPPPGVAEVLVDADGAAATPGWAEVSPPAAAPPATGATILLTGGLGGLASALAVRLHRRHGVNCVLVDHRPDAAKILARLAAVGTPVTYVAADVTDEDALCARLAPVLADRPVTAVVHCAGTATGGPVRSLDPAQLAKVVAPKLTGLRNILQVTETRCVLAYGSILARRPHPNAGAYALANELLRREVARRAGPGRLTAEWSIWDGAGIAHESGAIPLARRAGYLPIPLHGGLRMAERLLCWTGPEASVVVSAQEPGGAR